MRRRLLQTDYPRNPIEEHRMKRLWYSRLLALPQPLDHVHLHLALALDLDHAA
ncbi:MAG: hypothetical protein WBN35_10650 [Acidimicrobiia bacterium]